MRPALLLSPLLFFLGCKADKGDDTGTVDALLQVMPASPQRSGDPDAGWSYLLYGDYVGSGVPVDTFRSFFGDGTSSNPLGREGESATLPYTFNLFEAPNGVQVVGGINCFACHSSTLNGEFILGLGHSRSDFTTDQSASYALLRTVITSTYGEESPELAAYEILGDNAAAAAPYAVTPFMGVNPAFALEEVSVSRRDPDTLAPVEVPLYEPASRVASDVPPWWTVRKRHTFYYSAQGRGDLARLAMQICVVGVWDDQQAAAMDAHFPDVIAWLAALEPPTWPGSLDAAQVDAGAALFTENCARCHGTYDPDDPSAETYPNLLVHVDEVGTDPARADHNLDHPAFLDWLNESWFARYGATAEFKAERGYVAPPLDGVWATAPYLHNGSVPDLYTLLDSSTRPARWMRDFEDDTYDLERVGWPWEEVAAATSPEVYDTTRTGYGSGGHTYGDALTDAERAALVEYLKSL